MSPDKPRYVLSEHARLRLLKRANIQPQWIEAVVNSPERQEPDRLDPTLTHLLGRIEAYEGRVLRVIVNKSAEPWRIVTAYIDRKLRKLP